LLLTRPGREWPLATDRIFTAEGRFRREADMAGPAAGSTRSLVTLKRHPDSSFCG
jgi:hypothetical protein